MAKGRGEARLFASRLLLPPRAAQDAQTPAGTQVRAELEGSCFSPKTTLARDLKRGAPRASRVACCSRLADTRTQVYKFARSSKDHPSGRKERKKPTREPKRGSSSRVETRQNPRQVLDRNNRENEIN
ncbi:hypothetical protein B0H13DRAFT_1873741 [Mycena leptocephala]|nr:hypothetical protein B0H13DRAFT_1873741 [Mycena leptocephala]